MRKIKIKVLTELLVNRTIIIIMLMELLIMTAMVSNCNMIVSFGLIVFLAN